MGKKKTKKKKKKKRNSGNYPVLHIKKNCPIFDDLIFAAITPFVVGSGGRGIGNQLKKVLPTKKTFSRELTLASVTKSNTYFALLNFREFVKKFRNFVLRKFLVYYFFINVDVS